MNTLVTKHKVAAAKKTKILLTGFVYYALALILLFTGITKIIDPLPLIDTLKLLPLISEPFIILAATLLPVVEIGLGLQMLFKIKPKITLSAVTILFATFFLFSIYGALAGFEGDCGCLSANAFGEGLSASVFGADFGNAIKSEFGWGMIMRNLILQLSCIYIDLNKNVLQD